MNGQPSAVRNVAQTRARKRKMTIHRMVWAGLFMFGAALMAVAILEGLGVATIETGEPAAVSSSEGGEIKSAGSGLPSQPRWTGVLAFGGIVAGIGLLGFALAGGFGALADFMRSDP